MQTRSCEKREASRARRWSWGVTFKRAGQLQDSSTGSAAHAELVSANQMGKAVGICGALSGQALVGPLGDYTIMPIT